MLFNKSDGVPPVIKLKFQNLCFNVHSFHYILIFLVGIVGTNASKYKKTQHFSIHFD